jgi:hypothetical protein
MQTALLISLLSAGMFYLGSRAIITRWLWSKYPLPLAKFFDCSACSGCWYGMLLAATLGRYLDLAYLGLSCREWLAVPVIGLASIVTTPIIAGIMQAGFERLGSAVPEEGA